MSTAAFACLWAFVFVLPWEDVLRLPLLGSIPHVAGVVALGAGVLYVLARGTIRPPSPFHIFALLFVLWAGLSSLWSIDSDATRDRVLTYSQLAALVWLIWEIVWSPARQRGLLQAYVLGACVAAAGTIQSYLAGISLTEAGRFSTLNSNPNQLGLTLAMGLPMAWYLALAEPRQPLAWVWHLFAPLGITAILLTASRTALVATLVTLLIVPWTLGRLQARAKVAVCLVGVVSLLLASQLVPRESLERLQTTRSDIATGHFGGRGAIWKSGLEVVREHPLLGVGAGAFGVAVEPTLRTRWSSHQTFLAILAEDGVIGLAIFLAAVATALLPLRRVPALQRKFSIALLGALGVASVSGAWDYRKHLWFVLGWVAAQAVQRVASGPDEHNGRRSVIQSPLPEPVVPMSRPW